jgi:dTDP-glucose pyrophosphorylase
MNMNVLFLMAGDSSAFSDAGYQFPKNLVEISGKPLLERVLDTVAPLREDSRLLFVINRDENERYHTGEVIRLLAPESTVVCAQGQTAGAACTALLAVEWIDNDGELLVINGDIIVEENLSGIVDEFRTRGLDGGIPVFQGVHPRWSYVKVDEKGLVMEAAEKRPISRNATAGIYHFAHGRDFVQAAMRMIKKDACIDGKFYVCPAFNEMVLMNKRVGIWNIKRESYFSLATPQGVREYEDHLRAGQSLNREYDDLLQQEHYPKPGVRYAI